MEIKKVETDKKRYMGLLLLADEQEDMVDRYLERGTMYVLEDEGVKAECVVTDEGDGILELKNLAVGQVFFYRQLRPSHLRVRGTTGGHGVSAKRAMKSGAPM